MIPLSAHPAAKLRQRQIPGQAVITASRAFPARFRASRNYAKRVTGERSRPPAGDGRPDRIGLVIGRSGGWVSVSAAEGQPGAGRGTAGRLAAAGCRAWLTAVFLWPWAWIPGRAHDPAWRGSSQAGPGA